MRLEAGDTKTDEARTFYLDDTLMKVLPHAQKRMETLSDFAPLAAFLVSGTLPITEHHLCPSPGPVLQ